MSTELMVLAIEHRELGEGMTLGYLAGSTSFDDALEFLGHTL